VADVETVEIEPGLAAEAAVILMHGLGADGHDFESLVPELRLPQRPALRWVFPHAPVRPVTLNGGYPMRAWYDILALDRRAQEDETGLRESCETIRNLVRRENHRGIPSHRIVLAGFSQGAAMALFTGLRHDERLAGILALSGYLPLYPTMPLEASTSNAATPIFMAHGTMDPVVPLSLAEASRDHLARFRTGVDFRTYPMPHSLSAQEVEDVREWLLGVLSPAASAGSNS
jgi:phospholipase/carboxylesterase